MPNPNQGAKDVKDKAISVKASFRWYRVTEKANQRQDDGEDEDEAEDSQDGEEDDMEDFLEPEEERAVDNGAPHVRSRSIPLIERTMFMKGRRGKEKDIKVKGKFIMDGPWWNITFEAIKTGNVYICQGTPTYALRDENDEEKGKTLLRLLLSYVFNCPQPGSPGDQKKQSFWRYIEKRRSVKRLKKYTFKLFFEALEDALREKVTPDYDNALLIQAAKEIMRRFDPLHECLGPSFHSDDEDKKKTPPRFDLRYVYRCFKCPRLFEKLPLLQEREALSSLSTDDLSDLACLESVLLESPADLGFHTSMRRHNWGTMEVPFEGFVKAGMIPPNLFKCTAKEDNSKCPSAKFSGKQNRSVDQPTTSTSNQDTTAATSSRPRRKRNATPKVSVMMAKALKLYDIVKSRCREGKHTFLYESNVRTGWRKDACQGNSFGNIRDEAFVELQNRNVVEIEVETSQPQAKFHWKRYRRYEERIARSLGELISQDGTDPWTLPLGDFSKYNLDSYQLRAAQRICQHALTIILGGGGCGKTYVVASFIKEFLAYKDEERKRDMQLMKELMKEFGDDEFSEEKDGNEKDKKEDEEKESKNVMKQKENPSVLLTAPTGRAASILKRRIGMEDLEAKTLHSVLGSTRKCDVENFIYSKVEILVVDECSLVPISVLSEILSTLLCYKLKKVIFLGDPYQLPSIDPGNFLEDIIKVFQITNHNVIQTLKINHRTDEGGRIIGENARRIAEEKRSDLIYERDRFEMLNISDRVAGSGQEQVIERLIKNRRQLEDHKNSQAVAFRNVDVKDINRVCCHYYAAHAPFKKGKPDHHIKDKICARKNSTIGILWRSKPQNKEERKEEAGGSRDPEVNKSPGEEEAGPSNREEKKAVDSERISNGDTFFIENWSEVVENNGKKRTIVTLQSMDEEEGTLIKVDFKEMKRKCKIQYAWARTINTYQGSETDYVVYVVSPNSYYETWQHLYTAITRGRKGCFIVGTPESVNRVVKTNPRKRQTSLTRFLAENFGALPPQVSRPSLLGHANAVTPERPTPRDASNSNRVPTASSPYSWTPRQEQPVRGSPLLQTPRSNPTTPLCSPYQRTPLGRQVVPASKSTPGPSSMRISGATPVQSLTRANMSSSCRMSTSAATPVQSVARLQEMATLFDAANLAAPARAVAVPECTSSLVGSTRGQSSAGGLPQSTSSSLTADHPRSRSSAVLSPTCLTSAVGSLRCQAPTISLPPSTSSEVDQTANRSRCTSSAEATPGSKSASGDTSGYQSSTVHHPRSEVVHHPESKQEADVPSEDKVKAKRSKLSRKRTIKNNSVPVNKAVPCPQKGERTDPVDTEVVKKKVCVENSSSPESTLAVKEHGHPDTNQAVREREHPDRDQAVRKGTKQTKRTSLPAQHEGKSSVTASQPKEQKSPPTTSGATSCSTDGYRVKSGFKFSLNRLKRPKNTESTDIHHLPKTVKMETPTSAGEGSPRTAHMNVVESHSKLSSGSSGEMNAAMLPEEVQSSDDFSLALRSDPVTNPVNTMVMDSEGFHSMSKSFAEERPSADGGASPTQRHGNGKDRHSKLSRGSRGKMNKQISPREVQSSGAFRSPLPCLASRSRAAIKSGSTETPQGKKSDAFLPKKGHSPRGPKGKKGQENATRSQPKPQSPGSSQETVIFVPGLSTGRYRHTRRLCSQESEEEPSAASRKSSECMEDCPFEDSSDQEQSQFLLQPPPVMHITPHQRCLEESQRDADDEMESSSSDESAFSSSSTSPCSSIGSVDGDSDCDDDDDDDEDSDVFGDDSVGEEMSQFIFQLPDED